MFAFAPFFMEATPRSATPFAAYFPGNATSATMGTGSTMLISGEYEQAGHQIDQSVAYVRRSGVTQVWSSTSFPATQGPIVHAASFGNFAYLVGIWAGAGTYEFWFAGRSVDTGLFDQISNTITLVVS